MAISYDSNMVSRIVSSLIDIKHTLRLVYQHAVDSVNPYTLIRKELKCVGDALVVGNETYKLNNNIYLVGFGKAVIGMGLQAESQLGSHLKSGILSIPLGQKDLFRNSSFGVGSVVKIFEGADNNIPDKNAENNATLIANLAKSLTENDILIVLISGGGSALLPLSIPPITLEDKINVIRLLQRSGADIAELNTVRKRLSVLKGGGLLNLAYPAQVISFILSDIVGDPLDLIASAPTVYSNDSPEKAKNIFEKYKLLDKIPASVSRVIESPVEINQARTRVQNILIGTNKIALEAALDEAKKHNYAAFILTDILEGLVSEIFINYISLIECICKAMNRSLQKAELVKQLQHCIDKLAIDIGAFTKLIDVIYLNKHTKLCLLFGGEPTVKITGSGKGGRSQQLCLQFSNALHQLYSSHQFMEMFNIGLLCAGTDGIDGPTDAAGAVAYNGQISSAYEQNLEPDSYIKNCDAYTFFSKLQNGADLLKIGHTGTNVMDIHILVIELINH